MSTIEVSAKRKDDANAVTVKYDLGATVEELVDQLGADIVATKARQSIIIDLQAFIRRQITPDKDGKTKSLDEIQAAVSAWKPDGRTTVKKTAAEKAQDAIKSMSDEDRKALLKQLKSEGLL